MNWNIKEWNFDYRKKRNRIRKDTWFVILFTISKWNSKKFNIFIGENLAQDN